jgi:hypothetical protein
MAVSTALDLGNVESPVSKELGWAHVPLALAGMDPKLYVAINCLPEGPVLPNFTT